MTQDEKLKNFIFSNLKKGDINQLYKEYKREKLKDKLNIIKNNDNNLVDKNIQNNFIEAD